ncbi:MAG: hypothetical protein MJZ37_06535 [Bacilli bacterium]|nr:hypothetical protein [Bacilli bacterium]
MRYVDRVSQNLQKKCRSNFLDILEYGYHSFSNFVIKEQIKQSDLQFEKYGFMGFDFLSFQQINNYETFKKSESVIRKYLINRIIKDLLEQLCGYKVTVIDDSCNLSNFDFESRWLCELLYTDGKDKCVVKYVDIVSDELFAFCRKVEADKLYILDTNDLWKQTDKVENLAGIKVTRVGFLKFLKSFLLESETHFLNLFFYKVFEEYKEEVGLDIIIKLTPSKLFNLRFDAEQEFLNFKKNLALFKKIEEEGHKQYYVYKLLNDSNADLIIDVCEESKKALFESGAFDNFFSNNLYKVLLDRDDASKSFLTSEYLFNIYNEHDSLDYTSVVAGYLKSIEQLLHKVVMQYLDKQNEFTGSFFRIKCSFNNGTIPLITERIGDFDTTIGSLINFLSLYKKKIFKVSEVYYRVVLKCLRQYKTECRNGSFHLHNNYDWKKIEKIRHNTYVLYILLLGSIYLNELPSNSEDKVEHLYYAIKKFELDKIFVQKNQDSIIEMFNIVPDDQLGRFDGYGHLKKCKITIKSEKGEILSISNDNFPYKIILFGEHDKDF